MSLLTALIAGIAPPALAAPVTPGVASEQVISAEDKFANIMKFQPQVPPDIKAPRTSTTPIIQDDRQQAFVDRIYSKKGEGLTYFTDNPQGYVTSLKALKFNVNKLNSVADNFKTFAEIPDDMRKTKFPGVWKLLKPEKQEQAYNAFLADRIEAQKISAKIGVDADVLQAQGFHESGIFSKPSGINNFAGVKISQETRKALGPQIKYNLKPGTVINITNLGGPVTGATLVPTSEGLEATTLEEAINLAKANYPGRWEPLANKGSKNTPNISQDKKGKYSVKIMDYFDNYKDMSGAGDRKLRVLENIMRKKGTL